MTRDHSVPRRGEAASRQKRPCADPACRKLIQWQGVRVGRPRIYCDATCAQRAAADQKAIRRAIARLQRPGLSDDPYLRRQRRDQVARLEWLLNAYPQTPVDMSSGLDENQG